MTTNHPVPTPPPAEPAPSPRPVEEIERDLGDLAGALEIDARATVRLVRQQLAADVPSLLARLRTADETLAAVGALAAEHWDWKAGQILAQRLRAILAEGASR